MCLRKQLKVWPSSAFIYGIIFVAIVTLPLLFAGDVHSPQLFHYGWSVYITPLCYVGLGQSPSRFLQGDR